MYLKTHKSYRTVVALCDKELIGLKFNEGKRQIYLRENFYKGQEYNEAQIVDLLKKSLREDSTFNIVGKKSINCAILAGVIAKENVDKINDIPFALVLI